MALCATGTAEGTALCDLSSTDGAQIIRIGSPTKAAAMSQKSRQNGGTAREFTSYLVTHREAPHRAVGSGHTWVPPRTESRWYKVGSLSRHHIVAPAVAAASGDTAGRRFLWCSR
jgi:hypothetical protein